MTKLCGIVISSTEFQFQRHNQSYQSDQKGSLPPVIAVEKALLWVRIDETLENVLNLCHYREEDQPRNLSDPPQYDNGELPSNYDPDPELFGSDTYQDSSESLISYVMSIDEKMRLDLDEVTTVINYIINGLNSKDPNSKSSKSLAQHRQPLLP